MLVAKQAPLAHKLNTPWRVSFESPSAETPLPASPEEKPGSSQRHTGFSERSEGRYINWRRQQCPAAAQRCVRGQQSRHLHRQVVSRNRPWHGGTVGTAAVGVLCSYKAMASWKLSSVFRCVNYHTKKQSSHSCNFYMPLNKKQQMPALLAATGCRNQALSFVQKICPQF